MSDSESNEFFQLGNPWKTHKEYKVLSTTSSEFRNVKLKVLPINAMVTSKSRSDKGGVQSSEGITKHRNILSDIQPCTEHPVSLEEIRSTAQSAFGLGMVVKLAARRGTENTKFWYFLASTECLPGGSESGAFISWCPYCETHFRDFTSIFRHYAGREYVAKAKPWKRQSWIKEVEIWNEETNVFKKISNPWKGASDKKKRPVLNSPETTITDATEGSTAKSPKLDVFGFADIVDNMDTYAIALKCSETQTLTTEYRNSAANQFTFPDLIGEETSTVDLTGETSKKLLWS